MEEKNENQENKNRINSDQNYYYLSPSQSMNNIGVITYTQNLKNLEPQDNLKKSKQRQLLKKEKLIKNNEEEKIDKINNGNYDIKSLTAVKRNKANRIFQQNLIENNSKDEMYKFNMFRKNNEDNNFFEKNINNFNMNFVYEKKNINKFKKLNSGNLFHIEDSEENKEKEPMDNIKKKKIDKNEINNEKNIIN